MANEKSWGCLGVVIGVILCGMVLIAMGYFWLQLSGGGVFDP